MRRGPFDRVVRGFAGFAPWAWLVACAPGCAGAGDDDGGEAAGSSSGDPTEGPPGLSEVVPAAQCRGAPQTTLGQFAGTLRGDEAEPASGGVCGAGGPDNFLRVLVPARADLRIEARGHGFVPRVSLTPSGCQKAPRLVCSADGFAAIDDVAAGTELVLTIGADPAVFTAMLADEPPADGPDPLGFEVDIGMRPVLAPGDVCMPEVLGRCATGTLCMPQTAEDAGWRCTRLAGDSCAEPEQVTLEIEDGVGTLVVDPNLPQSDAHRHSCTGGGTRERVLQVRLPDGLGAHEDLQIRSVRDEVGLAVRAPGCLATDELSCGAPAIGGTEVTIAGPAGLAAAGVAPYLFVELPDPGVLAEPAELQVRVVLHAPPVGAP